MKTKIGLLCIVFLLSTLAASCGSTDSAVDNVPNPNAIDFLKQHTVRILFVAEFLSPTTEGNSGGSKYNYPVGTGILVNNDGYVITANHILDMGVQFIAQSKADIKKVVIEVPDSAGNTTGTLSLSHSTQVTDFEVIARDEKHDLALLKLNLTGENNPKLGQTIHGFIFPQGIPMAISGGDTPFSTQIDNDMYVSVAGNVNSSTLEIKTGKIVSTEIPDISSSALTETVGLAIPVMNVPFSVSGYYRTNVTSSTLFSGGPVYSPKVGAFVGICINAPDGNGRTVVVPGKYIIDLLKNNNVRFQVMMQNESR
jgi:hypothetical protein